MSDDLDLLQRYAVPQGTLGARSVVRKLNEPFAFALRV
jgi:hypothetical protein